MTDLATKDDTGQTPAVPSSVDDAAATAVLGAAPPTDAGAPVQWAPSEPAPKKKRLWLWIGVPVAVVTAGAVAASLVLIAPGTSVAGVPVGLLTEGAATDAVAQQLAATTVVLGEGGPSVTAAELGATLDAGALASAAFDQRPMWNLTQWFGDPVSAPVTLDADTATAALRDALPGSYLDPVAATVAFDGTAYTVTPAVAGHGIDLDVVTAALNTAFAAGEESTTIDVVTSPVASPATTEKAQAAADEANAMLANIGFYVGDERTVPVDAATAASWLTITADAKGGYEITADAAKIQPVVDTLQPLVDRAAANGTVITNSDGTVLETTIPGADGRVLGDTSEVATEFAAQLASGNGVYTLPVEVTPAVTTTLQRLLEVDLSEQRLYLKENGAVVDSWYISSGESRSPTETGHYRVNSHYRVQTMTSTSSTDAYWNYDVPNVEWIMYFNGSQAFHGVYWHNNFGTAMSHGCVGMPNYRAEQIYTWAPTGTDVWIHA
ncbi:L,D-transpeptidase family protein [Microbacterium sp.]|uniref:L,D-transpeptidase family protein n=1 Tax=Microbacterium sp. TaxID=51671 RepID=UPI0039E3C04B